MGLASSMSHEGSAGGSKNVLKPWQKREWCIPKMSADFVARMEDVLDLYAEPYDPQRPVICSDETSTQLLADTRPPMSAQPGRPSKRGDNQGNTLRTNTAPDPMHSLAAGPCPSPRRAGEGRGCQPRRPRCGGGGPQCGSAEWGEGKDAPRGRGFAQDDWTPRRHHIGRPARSGVALNHPEREPALLPQHACFTLHRNAKPLAAHAQGAPIRFRGPPLPALGAGAFERHVFGYPRPYPGQGNHLAAAAHPPAYQRDLAVRATGGGVLHPVGGLLPKPGETVGPLLPFLPGTVRPVGLDPRGRFRLLHRSGWWLLLAFQL